MARSSKAAAVATAAVAVTSLGACVADEAATTAPPSQPETEAEKRVKAASRQDVKRVMKVEPAKRRPRLADPDLSMPAGTLYDVISRDDID